MDDAGGWEASGQAAWVGGGTFIQTQESRRGCGFRKESESNCRPRWLQTKVFPKEGRPAGGEWKMKPRCWGGGAPCSASPNGKRSHEEQPSWGKARPGGSRLKKSF